MSPKVQFVTGLLSAFVFPVSTWLIIGMLSNHWVFFTNTGIPYLCSIIVNLFIMRYFIRTGKESACYGIMIVTFAVMWAIFKWKM